MSMRERIAQGKLFTDDCEGLPEERLAAKKRMRQFNLSDPEDMETRIKLMNEIFGTEMKAWIEPPFYFCYGRHITLGEGTYLNMDCTFIDDGAITIGNRVMFGAGVSIATVGHPIDPDLRLKGYMYCAPVIIGDGCWIGSQVTICPGVTIGEHTVIGAGSVVTKDIPANVVAVGNPCRILRKIGEYDRKYYFKDYLIEQTDLEEAEALK